MESNEAHAAKRASNFYRDSRTLRAKFRRVPPHNTLQKPLRVTAKTLASCHRYKGGLCQILDGVFDIFLQPISQ